MRFSGMSGSLTRSSGDEARATDGNGAADYDIYLPEWLARRNKEIFGVLYLAGMPVTTAVLWSGFTICWSVAARNAGPAKSADAGPGYFTMACR